jgi:hypothetical protein
MSEKYGGGLLLRNFRKQKPNHPDFNGNEVNFCCPKCQAEYQIAIAAWEKSGARGKFYSLAISEPYRKQSSELPTEGAQQPQSAPATESSETRPPSDDDVPF